MAFTAPTLKNIAFAIILLPYICSAQTGSISGNAFWHYNDYIGNKPDAAADVYLFTGDSTKAPDNTQCDVMGNFKFDQIAPGKYLVLIVSRATTDDGTNNFIVFNAYKGMYREFLGFDITDPKAVYDSVMLLDNDADEAAKQKMTVWNAGKRLKQIEQKKAIAAAEKRRLLNLCVGGAPFFYHLALMPLALAHIQHKVYIQLITIKGNENKTVVADFGITYQ